MSANKILYNYCFLPQFDVPKDFNEGVLLTTTTCAPTLMASHANTLSSTVRFLPQLSRMPLSRAFATSMSLKFSLSPPSSSKRRWSNFPIKVERHTISYKFWVITLEPYLGTLVGGRRGVENGPAGGEGDSDFFCRVGESTFAPGGEKGTVKLQKEP